MSLFRYFGREKVKAVGENNNLEATKKDDDQSHATGVAKSRLEDPGWNLTRKKTLCFAVIADSFRKINLPLGAKKVTTVFVLMGSKNMK